MSLGEKYWLTVLITFCRYFSVIMMASGVVFVLLGYYVNRWYYIGLISWPLFIMWGIVNVNYLRAITKMKGLELSKIVIK